MGKCKDCKMAKSHNGANKALAREIRTSRPYELVTLDLAKFPRSRKGNVYLFLGVDHYSKRAVGRPIKDKRAQTIAEEFEYTFLPSFITVPERVLSDNGGEFSNSIFNNLMNKYQIQHHTIAPGYPASNGAVERLVGTVKSLLRAACMRGGEWDDEFPATLNAYNNTKHRALTGKPSEVFLANAARVVMPRQSLDIGSGRPHKPYSEGDRVLKKVEMPATKTSPRYEPGFIIVRVNPACLTYVIRRMNPGPGQLTLLKAHHNQLKYESAGPVGPVLVQAKERVASAVITLQKLSQATCRVDRSHLPTDNKVQGTMGEGLPLTPNLGVVQEPHERGAPAVTDLVEDLGPPVEQEEAPTMSHFAPNLRVEPEPQGGAAAAADLVEALGPPGERRMQGPDRLIRRSSRNRSQPKYLEYYHLGKKN